jgi:hypothetical protein
MKSCNFELLTGTSCCSCHLVGLDGSCLTLSHHAASLASSLLWHCRIGRLATLAEFQTAAAPTCPVHKRVCHSKRWFPILLVLALHFQNFLCHAKHWNTTWVQHFHHLPSLLLFIQMCRLVASVAMFHIGRIICLHSILTCFDKIACTSCCLSCSRHNASACCRFRMLGLASYAHVTIL